MSIKPFKTIISEDENLNKVQTNIQTTINSIPNSRLVSNQSLSHTGVTTINHGLGYIPKWEIVNQQGPSMIWDNQTNNANANMTLQLYSSNDVVVSIRFSNA